MEATSNKFLKITGILMIISGVLGAIVSVLAVVGVSVLVAAIGAEAEMGLLVFASILALVSSVISLVAGILGVKNAAKPEKAKICIIFGILTVVFSIAGNVLTVVGGGSFNMMSVATGLVVPVLYLVGAFQNKAKVVE